MRDRLHPTKRQRPIAAGRVSKAAAAALAAALTAGALALAFSLNAAFGAITVPHGNVVIAEFSQCASGALRELAHAFDRIDFTCDFRKHCRCVP